MVELISDADMNRVISHLSEVKREVRDKAHAVKDVAEARLADHRKTGSHQVTETHGDVDSFVNLDGPAPAAVEFGHMVEGKYKRKEPKFVRGLYIITGAAGLTE